MICKFCGEEKGKLVRAHIIPDWMMRLSYDHLNRVIVVSGLRDGPVGGRIVQKGRLGVDVDNRLTCRECDVIFSQWEGNARQALIGGRVSLTRQVGFDDKYGHLEYDLAAGLDYREFKLFILSVLWRLGVSRNSGFDAVDLGKHERLIHGMLRTSDPGDPLRYPIAIFRLESDGQSIPIVGAWRGKYEGLHAVNILAGGFLFGVVVSNRVPRKGHSLFLTEHGTAVIGIMDPREIPLVRKSVKEMPPKAVERIHRLNREHQIPTTV